MAHKKILLKLSESQHLTITGEYTPRIPSRSMHDEGTPESFELEHVFYLGHDITLLLDALDTLHADLWRSLDEKIMEHIRNEN